VEDRSSNTDFDAFDSMLAVELDEAVSFAPKLVPRVGSPPGFQRRTITAVVRACGKQHARLKSGYGPFSGTTRVSRYQKGKSNLDFTEARDS